MTNQHAINILKGLEQSLDDYCELNDEGKAAFCMAVTALELFGNSEQLPSAQPEERTEKRTETHACDSISRQAAIDALKGLEFCHYMEFGEYNGEDTREVRLIRAEKARDALQNLPSAQPEIICCKDCAKHNKGHGYYLDGTVIGVKDCCPLVEIRGMAQGHEFDYQYCAYAERRTDG